MNFREMLWFSAHVCRPWCRSIIKQTNCLEALVFRTWILYMKSLVWQRDIEFPWLQPELWPKSWHKSINSYLPVETQICAGAETILLVEWPVFKNRLYKPLWANTTAFAIQTMVILIIISFTTSNYQHTTINFTKNHEFS